MSDSNHAPTTPALQYAGLTEVAKRIEGGELSPVDVTRSLLARIEALDGRLSSYETVTSERALAAAEAAAREIEAGHYRGLLHGVPVAVKDLVYTRGVATRGGLRVLADHVPDADATVVARLEEAGAVLLGKLTTTEGAMGGYHRDFRVPVNPWGDELWPGASSSGSGVSTAAGLCFAALGSDTGGSIRFPAMANGVVGLKPTYGRVSRHGVLPLAESMDHVGPLARRVADAAAVLQTIAGHDPADPTSLDDPVPDLVAACDAGAEGRRIGFDRAWATEGVDAGLVAAIEKALGELERLGATVVDIDLPAFPESHVEAWFALCAYEAAQAHAAHYPERAEDYGEYFGDFLALGSAVTEEQRAEASSLRQAFNQPFRAALESVDAVACPAGGVPFPIEREIQYGGMDTFGEVMDNVQLRFTAPADFAGTPAIALPCGANEAGVPYTLQLLGAALTEPVLCAIAHAYEQATRWHRRHPPL